MNKTQGFTLVELLAVIVILAIILVISVPSISDLIQSSTRGAFESDAKMVLKELEYKKLSDINFDSTTITVETLSSLNLSSDNYSDIRISKINDENYIYIKGKNKWNGLTACGTSKAITLVDSSTTTDCQIFNFTYSGNYQAFTVSQSGNYQFEAWGAQGGGVIDQTAGSHAGLGGYTKGSIHLTTGEKIYIYVGGAGIYTNERASGGGWNGGGNGGSGQYGGNGGGGGATDFRLINGNWNNAQSLYSRIMVAGAGGGCDNAGSTVGESDDGSGGSGGGLIGENARIGGLYASNTGGTQTTGALGKGQDVSTPIGDMGAAGSGYRGGFSTNDSQGGGGGGSSFISGYTGCDAIDAAGSNTGQPNHYSGKIFTNTSMIPGTASMPSPSGSAEVGHSGNGYARITYLGE